MENVRIFPSPSRGSFVEEDVLGARQHRRRRNRGRILNLPACGPPGRIRGAHQAAYDDPLLFAIEKDTNESYDVIARHPKQATRLHAAIEAWERELFAKPRGWK